MVRDKKNNHALHYTLQKEKEEKWLLNFNKLKEGDSVMCLYLIWASYIQNAAGLRRR